MCLAIYKPAGVRIPKKHLQTTFVNNPDGAGFAIRENGTVSIAKGYFSFAAFWQAWRQVAQYEALIHFRMASAGSISADNCHPFALANGGAMVHNGHISAYGQTSYRWDMMSQSDTALWTEDILNPVLTADPRALESPAMRLVLERIIDHSKIAILPPHGPVVFLNAPAWHTSPGGVTYSNHSYLPQATPRAKAYAQTVKEYGCMRGEWYDAQTLDDTVYEAYTP